jgi:hypothetical protein
MAPINVAAWRVGRRQGSSNEDHFENPQKSGAIDRTDFREMPESL